MNTLSAPKQTELNELHHLAVKNLQNAYVRYQKFPVSSIIQTPDKKRFLGVNVQNASSPIGLCAECVAVGAMVSQGYTQIETILVVSESLKICPPCGGCRQMISEFATPETLIALATPNHVEATYTINDLLPIRFELESLDTVTT